MAKPRVRTMRQPPDRMPRVIAVAQASMTQNGTSKLGNEAAQQQDQGQDAHALLGVVGAVRKGQAGGGDELQRRAGGLAAGVARRSAGRSRRCTRKPTQKPISGDRSRAASTLTMPVTRPWASSAKPQTT
jgi:hypothetical protein